MKAKTTFKTRSYWALVFAWCGVKFPQFKTRNESWDDKRPLIPDEEIEEAKRTMTIKGLCENWDEVEKAYGVGRGTLEQLRTLALENGIEIKSERRNEVGQFPDHTIPLN